MKRQTVFLLQQYLLLFLGLVSTRLATLLPDGTRRLPPATAFSPPEVRELFLLTPGLSVGGRLACIPMSKPGPDRLWSGLLYTSSTRSHRSVTVSSAIHLLRPFDSSGCYIALRSCAPVVCGVRPRTEQSQAGQQQVL